MQHEFASAKPRPSRLAPGRTFIVLPGAVACKLSHLQGRRDRSRQLGHRLRSSQRPLLLAGAQCQQATAPFALAQLPSEAPPAGAIAAVVALGALGSGIAYLLYFRLIASAGASRAILVTYLVPAFALVYGAVFLGEDVTTTALVGLALILAGTALATGLARRAAPSAPPTMAE